MANPRQNRARRSGINKVSQSKKSKKNQKKVVFKGPPVLAEAWDKHKTVRQNYAALGLLNTPNPRMSGGLEPLPVTPFVQRQQQAEASTSAAASAPESSSAEPSTSSSAKIPKGYARLIRDEEGNVVDVEFAQEEDAGDQAEGGNDSETAGATPWGQPLHSHEEDARPVHLPADHGVRRTQGIPMPDPAGDGIHVPHKPRPAPTAVVQELERMAANQRAPEKRTASERERDWLVTLVRKYDDDVGRMSRDIKRNPLQKTPAQIRKSIKLAGGFEALRSS